MTEDVKCSSCKKRIVNDIGAVSFKCPNCGKTDVYRCKNCRELVVKYKCSECGFEGPN